MKAKNPRTLSLELEPEDIVFRLTQTGVITVVHEVDVEGVHHLVWDAFDGDEAEYPQATALIEAIQARFEHLTQTKRDGGLTLGVVSRGWGG